MATVVGELIIERPPEIVFDVVADQRNEPGYNPDLLDAEKLTEGPIGVGTCFRARHRAGRRPMEMTVELTEYDPPRHIASRTTAGWATITGAVDFEPAGGGTRMRWTWDVRATGIAKLLTPVIGIVGRREERACWTGLKRYLEAHATASLPAAGSTATPPAYVRRPGRRSEVVLRTASDKWLNNVQRPQAYREVMITSAGAPIVLSVWDGQPGRAAVVFLPGTMTHPLFYEEFLDALNRAGITVVGVHSQGHGKSPRVPLPLTFSTLVTNARDAVAWTRHEFHGVPVTVLGSSQGGIVAMALAATGEHLDAVFAHNILDPTLPATIDITRFPRWLSRVYPAVRATFAAGGRLLPRVRVPFDAYLDMDRVARDPDNAEYFYTDPLGLRSYPLAFMASLFAADLSGMRDGSITCPVVVIAGERDPLFPLSYTRQVYDGIVAPTKELLVVDSGVHLLFNEDIDAVLPPLLDRLAVTSPTLRARGLGSGRYQPR